MSKIEWTENAEKVCRYCESFDYSYCIHPKYLCHPYHPCVIYCKGFIREAKNIN
jgi:hypothetical protein